MKTNPFAGMPPPARRELSSDLSDIESEEGAEFDEKSPPPPPVTPEGVKRPMLRTPGEYAVNPEKLELELANLHIEKVEDIHLKALTKLTEETGMPITQENGQRRYGPPLDENAKPPNRGSEVFVGKIPRDCLEPELVPVFSTVGRIYEMRLMMDFSGTNRGYCFVQYFTPEEADLAVVKLNNYEIRKGRRMGVVKSVDNCRLFFGNIPWDKTEEEIFHEVDKVVDGVVKVVIFPSKKHGTANRGFAFVEFESHKAAAMAKRKLITGKFQMWGQDVTVDWADPINESDHVDDSQPDVKKKKRNGKNKKQQQKQVPHQQWRQGQGARVPGNNPRFHFVNQGQPMYSMHGAPAGAPVLPQPQLQFTPSLYLSVQQQAMMQRGGGDLMTSSMHMNRWQEPSQPSPNYPTNAPTEQTYATSPPYCGIPGVPPNVYFSQWQQPPPLPPTTQAPVLQPLCNQSFNLQPPINPGFSVPSLPPSYFPNNGPLNFHPNYSAQPTVFP